MNTEQVQEIFVEDIIPNRFQPRLTFDEKALQELSDSIKAHGVIQPLVLRRVGNKYEIIAGERRYKASCMAGLKKVPAIVREMTDNESAEVALIENIQRKNLTSIEEAQSYRNLLDRGYLTQEELANKLGVTQPTIANKMRLLNLCDEVQNALLNEQISERHARSLLAISNPDEQKAMLNRIIKERLTVKQLDNEIKKMTQGDTGTETNAGESGEIKMEPIFENNIIVGMAPAGSSTQSVTPTIENTFISPEPANEEAIIPTEPRKNIFGMNIETTDLEATAPNLNVGTQDIIPPASFNPFNMNAIQSTLDSLGPVSQAPAVEEQPLETFDMFGDTITPTETAPATTAPEKNIGDQINSVRETVKAVEGNGFKVEVEEYDFQDLYQFVIKIKK